MKILQVTSREQSNQSLSQSKSLSLTRIKTKVFRMYKASHSAMASLRREGLHDFMVV